MSSTYPISWHSASLCCFFIYKQLIFLCMLCSNFIEYVLRMKHELEIHCQFLFHLSYDSKLQCFFHDEYLEMAKLLKNVFKLARNWTKWCLDYVILLFHSVFPTLDWGWERNIRIFRGRRGMQNFQRQGRNILGGNQIFLDRGRWVTQNRDTKIIL